MSDPLPNPRAIYSFDDLLEIEELTGIKYELLDGHIMAMTGGTKAHNLIALGLFTEIDRQKDDDCRLYVADVKLRIAKGHGENNDDTSTYPDVMLACGEEDSDLYEENPILIAEVLSDSTARKDKVKKRSKYLGLSSLYAYIVLSQTEIMMTVHQRNDQGWTQHVFLGKDSEVELWFGTEHRPIMLNLARVYKYLEGRI
jgi:Uma2 family endonuclease